MTDIHRIWESADSKLNLLNYRVDFCEKQSIPHRLNGYIYEGTNAGVQFNEMVSLIAWLFERCGQKFEISEYDDPTTTINKIILQLKNMSFEMDFPASKLRQGYGLEVCGVIDWLAEQSLNKIGFRFLPPVHFDDNQADEIQDVEGEEIQFEDSESDSEDEMDAPESRPRVDSMDRSINIIEAGVDPLVWQAELEEVAPLLKVRVRMAGKEWRSHLDVYEQNNNKVNNEVGGANTALQKIEQELRDVLDRLQTKEQYLNTHQQDVSADYRTVHTRWQSLTEQCKDLSSEVNRLTQNLDGDQTKLEDVREKLEECNNGMTDTSPLVKIKRTIQKMKGEIRQMEMQMGVISRSLLQEKVRTHGVDLGDDEGSGYFESFQDDEGADDDYELDSASDYS
eukprot:TRINITY_DN781929_c0_g1_i1.p1 TRINITY_DN781929_c0_g1~~TRINITY_DN781929_c0_g1_i1.p1  ORF type:complete len:395 (-),score=125.01 TRINITY_DN781929_c0_g1_i1:224-1408(-)